MGNWPYKYICEDCGRKIKVYKRLACNGHRVCGKCWNEHIKDCGKCQAKWGQD